MDDRDTFHKMEALRWFNLMEEAIDEELEVIRNEPDTTEEARADWEAICVALRPAMKRAAVIGFRLAARMAAERGFPPLEWPTQSEP